MRNRACGIAQIATEVGVPSARYTAKPPKRPYGTAKANNRVIEL